MKVDTFTRREIDQFIKEYTESHFKTFYKTFNEIRNELDKIREDVKDLKVKTK